MNATIINIGRQFGSGGRRVAAALGVRLGIPVYDNELIAEAAQKSGFSKDIFMQRDEHKSNFTLPTCSVPSTVTAGLKATSTTTACSRSRATSYSSLPSRDLPFSSEGLQTTF